MDTTAIHAGASAALLRGIRTGAVLLGVLPSLPAGLGAAQALPDLAPASLGARCHEEIPPTPRFRVIRRAMAEPEDPDARAAVVALYDSVTAEHAAQPDRVDTVFLLAVIMGTRSEMESGKAKLEWAERMGDMADRVLELAPGHPGARHLKGRLHAAVLRMGTVKRWVARALFGGDVLGGASWEEARSLLEEAEQRAPCVPDHHYELAALYRDMGYTEAAAREAQHALELAALDPAYHGVERKARGLVLAYVSGGS